MYFSASNNNLTNRNGFHDVKRRDKESDLESASSFSSRTAASNSEPQDILSTWAREASASVEISGARTSWFSSRVRASSETASVSDPGSSMGSAGSGTKPIVLGGIAREDALGSEQLCVAAVLGTQAARIFPGASGSNSAPSPSSMSPSIPRKIKGGVHCTEQTDIIAVTKIEC